MQPQKIFGIKIISINDFTVYTLCVRVNETFYNSQIIQKESKGLSVNYIQTKNGPKIELKYTTMDKTVFDLATKTLGNILKQIAQENLNNKYQWTLSL